MASQHRRILPYLLGVLALAPLSLAAKPKLPGCEAAFAGVKPAASVHPLAIPFEPPRLEADDWHRRLGMGMFAASASDVASTEWGLARAGLHERNPAMRNRTLRLTLHVAAPALVWYATEKLREQGRPRLAFWARVGVIVAYGLAAAHNIRLSSGARASQR
jgi:hypothetical protein